MKVTLTGDASGREFVTGVKNLKRNYSNTFKRWDSSVYVLRNSKLHKNCQELREGFVSREPVGYLIWIHTQVRRVEDHVQYKTTKKPLRRISRKGRPAGKNLKGAWKQGNPNPNLCGVFGEEEGKKPK